MGTDERVVRQVVERTFSETFDVAPKSATWSLQS